MALSPLSGVDRTITLLAGQPLRLCGEEIDHPLALWQPWAFPGEWALSSVGIVEPGLDFNIMTQRGRASATVQVVSDLQCGVAYVLQGEWDLAGRRCAAGSGLCWRGNAPGELRPLGPMGACCWRRSRSNNQLREGILELSRSAFAPRGAGRLKNIVTQGVVSGI
jgi:hypothetical protein